MPLLRDITLGRYLALDSPVHRLDPRTKFIATLALMSLVFALQRFVPLLFFACFLGLLVALAHLPPGLVLGNLRAFVWLFAFTLLLHAFMTPGTALWRLPYLDRTLSAEGLERGAFFSLRLALIIVTASLLTLTTAPMELSDGLERLLAPLRRFGLPAHELAMMVAIALRFIPVLVEEAERLHKAQLARGADFGGGPIRRARSLVPLLVPLFVSAFERADRLALAMESRCYRGGAGRTHFHPLHLGARDLRAALVLGAVLGLAFAAPRLWPALP